MWPKEREHTKEIVGRKGENHRAGECDFKDSICQGKRGHLAIVCFAKKQVQGKCNARKGTRWVAETEFTETTKIESEGPRPVWTVEVNRSWQN